jgi:hypothetical protein
MEIDVNEKIIEEQIDEIVGQFLTVAGPVKAKGKRVCASSTVKSRALDFDNIQDSLEYLRISVKYLMFDLEATRRENKYLRQMLDK